MAPRAKAATAAVTHETFGAAFLAAQAEMPAIQRDSINGHLKNRYASLAAIVPAVLETAGRHGLLVMQLPSNIDGSPAVWTRIQHAASGEGIEATTPLPGAGKDTGHAYGSGLTYMRRYSLTAAFGLVTENDDDGNAATPDVGARQPLLPQPPGLSGAMTADDGNSPDFGASL